MDISKRMSIIELARNYRDSTAQAQPERDDGSCGRLTAAAGNEGQGHLLRAAAP